MRATRSSKVGRPDVRCERRYYPTTNYRHISCGATSRIRWRDEVGHVVAALSPATLTCNLTSISYIVQLNLFANVYEVPIGCRGLQTNRPSRSTRPSPVISHHPRPLNTLNQQRQSCLSLQTKTSKPPSNATASWSSPQILARPRSKPSAPLPTTSPSSPAKENGLTSAPSHANSHHGPRTHPSESGACSNS